MDSWTLEKVSGLTPVKRVSFLGSIPPHTWGVLLLPFAVFWTFSCLCSAFFIEVFLFFLPFIPSGCSGSSISSVMGSVFSQALSSLVEHPTQTRSYCYSPGEGWESGKTGNEKKRGAEFPTIAGKHSSLRRPGRHCQDQPRGGLCQPLTCGAVKFPRGLGRGVASQRSDLATISEHRGSFVPGVSLILRWSAQCQKLWLKKKLKLGLTFKWIFFFFSSLMVLFTPIQNMPKSRWIFSKNPFKLIWWAGRLRHWFPEKSINTFMGIEVFGD